MASKVGDGRKSRPRIETIFGITATEAVVEDLTAGVYRFRVAAYNKQCNCWGKWRAIRYTHQQAAPADRKRRSTTRGRSALVGRPHSVAPDLPTTKMQDTSPLMR